MKRQIIKLIVFLVLANCLLTPILYKESLGYTTNDIQDFFITSDTYMSFYGSAYFNNEFNFVCSTAKIGNPVGPITVMHYTITEGKVEQQSIIAEEFADDWFYFTVTVTNRLYFSYVKSVKNESTGEYEQKIFCYYYNDVTKEKDNFQLEDLSNYQYIHLTGIKSQGNEVIFLIYNTDYYQNKTILTTKILDENEIKQTTSTTFLNCTFGRTISSCYSDTKNLAYFLFEEGTSDKFHLYSYNYTSRVFSLDSAFNFTVGMTYNIRSGGRLLYNEASDTLYLVCPKISDEAFNLALYQYNSTLSYFELFAEKNDCFGSTTFPENCIVFGRGKSYYDAFINGSDIHFLYKTPIAHVDLYDLMLMKYSINTTEWKRTKIIEDSLPLYYSCFLYNATARTNSLDSYFLIYHYEGYGYRTFTRNHALTTFAFLGEYEINLLTPFLLRVIPTTIYWIIICGIIVGSIIMVSGLSIGIRFLVKRVMFKKRTKGKTTN